MKNKLDQIVALLRNIGWVFVVFMLCRVLYWYVNRSFFPGLWDNNDWLLMLQGALQFDLSGILYFNILYLVLILIPLPYQIKSKEIYQQFAKWIYIVFNSLALFVNLSDVIYFKFVQRRATASVFTEFGGESNILKVYMEAIAEYWPIALFGLLIVLSFYFLYKSPRSKAASLSGWRYWIVEVALFLLLLVVSVIGIRGGVGRSVRPITLSNANQYVKKPLEASLILNTPFTLIRTLENKHYPSFNYYATIEEAQQYFSTTFIPQSLAKAERLNVVVLIMESFGAEYIGSLNPDLATAGYKGYTPFLDSLIRQSVAFETAIANGHKSIDGMPSVLASIPSIVEPYFVGDFGNNNVLSLAGDLKKEGYSSAFFHGAPNGSMGFWAFAKASGFDAYFGMDEYNDRKDFDGTWAIWDEPFMQFYAQQMTQMKEPFVTALFSASSHHPFAIPSQYEGQFPKGTLPIHQCVGYSDHALRKFFEKASQQKWFDNTLFIITADHTNQTDIKEYQSPLGWSRIPIIYYCPKYLKPEYRKDLTQQIDIRPSVLGLLGYNKPFVAFGRDVFDQSSQSPFAINDINGVYQLFDNQYVLQFDGEKPLALYDYRKDRLMRDDVLPDYTAHADSMTARLKAILQVYLWRMKENRLVYTNQEASPAN